MGRVPVIRGRVWKASGSWWAEVLSDGRRFPTVGDQASWPTWRLAMLAAGGMVRNRRTYWERANA